MSQATLFGFGAVIFFTVMTGVFLYRLAVAKESYKNTRHQWPPARSHYSLDEDGESWEVVNS